MPKSRLTQLRAKMEAKGCDPWKPPKAVAGFACKRGPVARFDRIERLPNGQYLTFDRFEEAAIVIVERVTETPST